MIDPQTLSRSLRAMYVTFGCKLNFAETSTLEAAMESRGIVRARAGEAPDLIVVNSCSVTEVADKKCRQAIRSLHRRFPAASIAVTGCYAQLKAEEVAQLEGVAMVAGNDRKGRIVEMVDRWLGLREAEVDVITARDIRGFVPACARGDRTRYWLKVQDGCDYWCSYCTIPMARGRSRSPRVDELVAQAREVAAAGGKEIVLTGVNIGDFGKGSDETFFDLVRRLDEVEGIERYRISSIEPNLLTDDIIRFVAESRRFMPHFHVPLQSGSDVVLRLMRRHYDAAFFAQKMDTIRALIPDAFIGVDLIVGARGETDEEFLRSKAMVEALPISRLHVFTYSERPGTRALTIDHVVAPDVKHRRCEEMLAISERKLAGFAQRFVGTMRPVLLEHSRPGHPMTGFTDNYLKVELDAPARLDNHIARVELLEASADGAVMRGRLIDQQ